MHRSPRPLLVTTALSLLLVASPAHAHARPLVRPAPTSLPLAPRPCTGDEPPRGVGLMVGGGVALGLSIPIVVLGLMKAGGRCLRLDGDCANNNDVDAKLTGGGGLVALGMLGALGGTALLAYGGNTHRNWRKWKAKQPTLAPRVARSPHGTWTMGVALRF